MRPLVPEAVDPNLYYKPAKEFADLLVVFGNDVLIFSDKFCAFLWVIEP